MNFVTIKVVTSLGIGFPGHMAKHMHNIPKICQTIFHGCAISAFSEPIYESCSSFTTSPAIGMVNIFILAILINIEYLTDILT